MLSLSQCLPVYSFYLSHALFVFKSVIFQLMYFSSSAFYRTFLCNYISLSLFLFPRYASHISILLPTIHNGGDIYAVSNCLRQSVCLPVSACLSASVWLIPLSFLSISLPAFSLCLCAFYVCLSYLPVLYVSISVFFLFFFVFVSRLVSFWHTRRHNQWINQSVTCCFHSSLSLDLRLCA